MHLILELFRSRQAADPFAFATGPQEYVRRTDGGGAESAMLDWNESLLADLTAVSDPACDPAVLQRMGTRLQKFLGQTDWSQHAAMIVRAVEARKPVILTLRLSAAELYLLPWELLTLKASGKALGELPGVLLRYEWPETGNVAEPSGLRVEDGRILVAYSAAGGWVPGSEHISAIRSACGQVGYLFDEDRDVVPHVSVESLLAHLERATDEDPIRILHILCHGVTRGDTIGLCWDGADGRRDVVDAARLRRALQGQEGRLRLVVLCACNSGHSGALGNHLGSTAQVLHRAGIRSVIASRFPLSTGGSAVMTESLYGELLRETSSLEGAVMASRTRLARSPGYDWASLQLFARAGDGDDSRPLLFRPFRGLLAFQPEHSRFFFGRDREIAEILSDLQALIDAQKPRLLIVAGASGTGKSSVVLAGAVPRLLNGPGARLSLRRMRPGAEPIRTLDEVLSAPSNAKPASLLIVDQFEEIFTHTKDPLVRQNFIQRLWSLAGDPASNVTVIVTLRVDFVGRCGELLVDGKKRFDTIVYDEAHRIFVAQMDVQGLRAAIEGPARKVGLRFEEGLVDRLLEDVEGEPGGLPLLEDALDLLWQRRKGTLLTWEAYYAVGGITGALTLRADKLVDGLGDEDAQLVRRLMVQLINAAEDVARSTRQRVPLASLRPADAQRAARFDRVLRALVDARLLILDGEDQTVEVAHEALIRKWPRLIAWSQEERRRLAELEIVEEWAVSWRELGTVLTRDQLEYVQETVRANLEDLSPAARELLECSESSLQLALPALSVTEKPHVALIDLQRAADADDPFAFRFEQQEYSLLTSGGGVARGTFSWDNDLLSQLAQLRRPGGSAETAQRIGERLYRFLRPLGWAVQEQLIQAAVRTQRRVYLTIRSAAAEIYALPWEMLLLGPSQQHIGELSGVTVRYEWPDTTTVPALASSRHGSGRILFAWSAAGGAVPAAEHQAAIASACEAGHLSFDPVCDVVAHASWKTLHGALDRAQREGRPIAILHLLCQSSQAENTFGLVLDADLPGESALLDVSQVRQLLGPFAAMVRLVVLMACDTSNTGAVGNQVGSIAQALHRVGIEAVVGARYPVRTRDSIELTAALYDGLLRECMSLESALLSFRASLTRDTSQADWAWLQLYARKDDGCDTRPIAFRPYRGMLPFAAEARFFAGREPEISIALTALQALVQHHRPRQLAVIGAQATGKSSLAMAGIVPAMVGRDPSLQLVQLHPGMAEEGAIAAVLSRAELSEGPLLIVADDFDRIFAADRAAQASLLGRLSALAGARDRSHLVIITLRSDFVPQYEVLLQESGSALAAELSHESAHRLLLAQMSRQQLRQAIEAPALRAGLVLEDGLVNRILDGVGSRLGHLALLQETMDQLWLRRTGRILTQTAYDEMGGFAPLLPRWAVWLIGRFPARELQQARALLAQLAQAGGGAGHIPLSRLRPKGSETGAPFERTLTRLGSAGLLVRSGRGASQMLSLAPGLLERKRELLALLW